MMTSWQAGMLHFKEYSNASRLRLRSILMPLMVHSLSKLLITNCTTLILMLTINWMKTALSPMIPQELTSSRATSIWLNGQTWATNAALGNFTKILWTILSSVKKNSSNSERVSRALPSQLLKFSTAQIKPLLVRESHSRNLLKPSQASWLM